MEGTHAVGRQPFMPDSTLSRRSAALHARLAKYPSGNHKIIPRIVIINENQSVDRFLGGQLTTNHIWIRGDIRAGRTEEQRKKLMLHIVRDVSQITGVNEDS